MALTKQQKITLRNAGFLPKEIFQLSSARGGDSTSGHTVPMQIKWSSKPIQAMIRSRRKWISNLKKVGWNDIEIKAKISQYYSTGRFTNIFSFIKLEYIASKKLSDWATATKLRIRAKASRVLGRSYGRNMRPTLLPRHLPKRPLLPTKPKLVRRIRRVKRS
jgi:hypothetical protein